MTNEAYHADTSRIGSSGLKLLAKKTPAHFYAEYLDPNRVRKPQTAAMAFGSLLHTVVLEPEKLERKYIVKPEGIDRRTNAGKAAYAEFELAAMGKEITTGDDIRTAQLMRDSIFRHPGARLLLDADGKAEETILFTHPETGSAGKARLDFINCERNLIIDVKTTEDASPAEFARSIYNYQYHLQSAWYLDGYFYKTGYAADGFVFIAVEKEPPFAAACYPIGVRSENIGRELYMKHLRIYEDCKAHNVWPAYGDTLQSLELPAWAIKQHEYQNKQEEF